MNVQKRTTIIFWAILTASIIGALALPSIGLALSRQRLAEYFDARTKAGFNDGNQIEASKIDDNAQSARASGAHYLGDIEKINEPMLIAKVLAYFCIALATCSGATLVYRMFRRERTDLAGVVGRAISPRQPSLASAEAGDEIKVHSPAKASLAYWIVPTVCLVPAGIGAFLLPIWHEMFAGFSDPYPAFTAILEQGRYLVLCASLFLTVLPFAILRKRELPQEKRKLFYFSTLLAVLLAVSITVAFVLPVIDLASNQPEKPDPAGTAQRS